MLHAVSPPIREDLMRGTSFTTVQYVLTSHTYAVRWDILMALKFLKHLSSRQMYIQITGYHISRLVFVLLLVGS